MSPTDPTWTNLIPNLYLQIWSPATNCLSYENVMTLIHGLYLTVRVDVTSSKIYRLYLLLQRIQILKQCSVALCIVIFPSTHFTLCAQLCLLVCKHSVSTYCHSFRLLLLTHLPATSLTYRTALLQLCCVWIIYCAF